MTESRWIYEFIGLAAFFNGILFLWLKWDLRDLKDEFHNHVNWHGTKNGKRK